MAAPSEISALATPCYCTYAPHDPLHNPLPETCTNNQQQLTRPGGSKCSHYDRPSSKRATAPARGNSGLTPRPGAPSHPLHLQDPTLWTVPLGLSRADASTATRTAAQEDHRGSAPPRSGEDFGWS